MFILLHSINLAVILLAAWIYLHPFDAARPSMQWIYVAHAIAFISLVLVVVQVFLCPRNRRRTGYLAFWGIRSQGWSVFVLMAAGFMYWVFDGGPLTRFWLIHWPSPAWLCSQVARCWFTVPSRSCFQRGVAVSLPKMLVMNRVPDDGRNVSVMQQLPLADIHDFESLRFPFGVQKTSIPLLMVQARKERLQHPWHHLQSSIRGGEKKPTRLMSQTRPVGLHAPLPYPDYQVSPDESSRGFWNGGTCS